MSAPYRNETAALQERKATLEHELARLREQTTQLDALRAAEADVSREVAEIDRKLGGRRSLPMLDQVKVASPCNASWDDMVGDTRVRFCLSCEKNVFNLSAMPRAEAEALLQERSNGELCVRYYQRADGTMMTADCPVGVKRKRRKKVALAVAGAGAMALAATTALISSSNCSVMMGEMRVPVTAVPSPEPPQLPMMGVLAHPVATPEPVAPSPPPHTLGRLPAHPNR